jgi:adenylate kinase
MLENKVITITGISGSGSKEFCETYKKNIENVRVYNVGDMIYEIAQNTPEEPAIPEKNFLNQSPKLLNAYRDRVFESILNKIKEDKKDYSRILIDTHAQFFWKDIYQNAYNWKHLNKIKSDMFISIIDKPSSIKENQMKTEQGKTQNHDFRDLLLWQNIEVNVTAGWASNFRKPMYVLPSKQDPTIIDSLLENDFLIYFQMPMTDASSEEDNEISNFKERLLDIGKKINNKPTPLIDPRDIDIETGENLLEKTKKAINRQTVMRDEEWYISKATTQVAFYPENSSYSVGVSDESKKGHETGKDTFVILPGRERLSPFIDKSKVFISTEKFFDFFPKYMEQAIEYYKR